jgi:hypothetical protein
LKLKPDVNEQLQQFIVQPEFKFEQLKQLVFQLKF